VFEDLIYQNLRQAGAPATEQNQLPTGLQLGLGVRPWPPARNFTQGNLQQTGNNLDVAIRATASSRSHARRHHRLHPRRLVPARRAGPAGHPTAMPCMPGITVPANATKSITHRPDGTVSSPPRAAGAAAVGQIQLASFVNPAGLDPQGQNLFCETAASGRAAGGVRPAATAGQLKQGFVETSNVNVVEELVTDDPDPARLRDELQGHPDLGPDAAAPVAAVMNAPSLPPMKQSRVALLAAASLLRRLPALLATDARRAGRHCAAGGQRAAARHAVGAGRPTVRSSRPPATGRCSRTTAHAWWATR
jgi:flagellar basal-body rod protein FlgG